jgi:hypothetical protein
MTELRRSVEGGIQALMTEAKSNANNNDESLEIVASPLTKEEEDLQSPQSDQSLITEVSEAGPGQSEPQLPLLTLPSPPEHSPKPESTISER